MRYSIFKRPAAERDIEECFVYIAEDNLDIGLAFLVAVEDSLERLAEFPLLGKVREFHSKDVGNVRMWHIKDYDNYLIFYTVHSGIIDVIRVLHGSRDIDDLFS